jgi:hypothetical protein
MIRPSSNEVTLLYGATTTPYTETSPHIGVDFSPSPDSAIYSPEDGRITLILGDPRMGDSIHLWAGNRHHALCHTSEHFVTDGQQVTKGEKLGIMGETGYAFGTHLHWALAISGGLVDPLSQVDEIIKGETDMLTAPNEVNDLIGALWGVPANDNDHTNWDNKPFHDFYVATMTDPRTFEYADKCYKALHPVPTSTPAPVVPTPAVPLPITPVEIPTPVIGTIPAQNAGNTFILWLKRFLGIN